MFALVAVGAAGVVDGFAAGLYIGHRFLTRTKVKDVVVETEEKAAETVQVVADQVKAAVAPAAVKPSADAFYPVAQMRHNEWAEKPVTAKGLLEQAQAKRFRASDALAVGEARSEPKSH